LTFHSCDKYIMIIGSASRIRRAYATRRKTAASRLDEVNELCNLPNPSIALGPGVYSACNKSEYWKQKDVFWGSRRRLVLVADNLTAICDPVV
jgi:hypothetical protein